MFWKEIENILPEDGVKEQIEGIRSLFLLRRTKALIESSLPRTLHVIEESIRLTDGELKLMQESAKSLVAQLELLRQNDTAESDLAELDAQRVRNIQGRRASSKATETSSGDSYGEEIMLAVIQKLKLAAAGSPLCLKCDRFDKVIDRHRGITISECESPKCIYKSVNGMRSSQIELAAFCRANPPHKICIDCSKVIRPQSPCQMCKIVDEFDIGKENMKTSKIMRIMEIVDSKIRGTTSFPPEKVVIGAHYLGVLDLVALQLEIKYGRDSYVRIDGDISDDSDRQELVDEFCRERSNPMVLLLSIRIGAQGLNIVPQNNNPCPIRTAIFVSSHWNMTDLIQFAGRADRQGQTERERFELYVLSTRGSIEAHGMAQKCAWKDLKAKLFLGIDVRRSAATKLQKIVNKQDAMELKEKSRKLIKEINEGLLTEATTRKKEQQQEGPLSFLASTSTTILTPADWDAHASWDDVIERYGNANWSDSS